MMRRWGLVVWGLCAVAELAAACDGLAVRDAWIREGPPGTAVLAGFGEIQNTGDSSLTITGVESARFMHVMMHETVYRKGQARMRAREALELAPGARVKMAPGGLHLMLMHGDGAVTAGQEVPLEFVCGKSRATVSFIVRQAPP